VGREIDLVVNPSAGGGRAGRLVGDMCRELVAAGVSARVHRTGARAHLAEVVRELVAKGAPIVGVMGGDGTFHDACDALLTADGTLVDCARTTFALLPAGTGGDFAARTLAMPSDVAGVAAWIARAKPTPVDLGVVEALAPRAGERARMTFTNIASCGLSGRVDYLIAEGPKWLTGKAAYFVATLRGLAGWRHRPVRLRVDGEVVMEGPILTVAVANGRAFGGGMIIAPQADCADGLLEVVALGGLGAVEIARNFPKIYKGEHLGAPGVFAARGRVVEIEAADDDVLLDVDGEAAGRLPARFRLLPSAISMLRA
jgi:YegS/Rv2252/BmrU family lipid kinase